MKVERRIPGAVKPVSHTGRRCPRCDGSLYRDLDGVACLTCGWRQDDRREGESRR